ncbi:MAG TPA: aminotransferase class I/II-fold pyridoxal phosphate-dependent enzyme [Candidatus Limnocylindrales bacterium]|jgi:aspartate aminotransferase
MAVTAVRRADALRETIAPFLRFFTGAYDSLEKDPDTANFAVGNPHEFAMPSYVDALERNLKPQNKDWFAYKLSEPEATSVVARTMSGLTGLDWDPRDVNMTNGGFAAIAVSLRTLLEPGDEAIFLSPPWFFYEQLIVACDATPVRVRLQMPDCVIDPALIEPHITPRTRVVILNTPHNPSGRVVSLDELRALAELLTRKSHEIGHPIYIVSDEPYRRIVFDGRDFHTPAEVYPNTFVTYSYGKQLLAPGMRIGYFTWPPNMPNREKMRDDAFVTQFAAGYSFPNADLQHALADLEKQCISIPALEARRERLIGAMRNQGYETTWPAGTFYVMARSPIADDEAFTKILASHKVLVLPGTVVEVPGWFRISLTASDEMVETGIGRFEQALNEAKSAV